MSEPRSSRPLSGGDIALRVAIVALALSTAYIHLTLGGLRFTLNATGYVVLAAAMIAPIAIAVRYRWLIRLALAGYAATTIVAWAVEGAFYSTAYLAKAIELALIALLVIDLARRDGNPRGAAAPRGPVAHDMKRLARPHASSQECSGS